MGELRFFAAVLTAIGTIAWQRRRPTRPRPSWHARNLQGLTIGCDNRNRCEAVSLLPGSDWPDNPVMVGVARSAGPDAAAASLGQPRCQGFLRRQLPGRRPQVATVTARDATPPCAGRRRRRWRSRWRAAARWKCAPATGRSVVLASRVRARRSATWMRARAGPAPPQRWSRPGRSVRSPCASRRRRRRSIARSSRRAMPGRHCGARSGPRSASFTGCTDEMAQWPFRTASPVKE